MLYDRRFSIRLRGAVYESDVKPAILYGSEECCMKESEMGILRRTKRSMVRAMCGVQSNGRKRSTNLMFMLGLHETIDQLAMANSVRWYGLLLRRKVDHVLRRAYDFEVEGKRMKGRLKRTWKNQVEEESVNLGLRRQDALCLSNWSVGVNQVAAGFR